MAFRACDGFELLDTFLIEVFVLIGKCITLFNAHTCRYRTNGTSSCLPARR